MRGDARALGGTLPLTCDSAISAITSDGVGGTAFFAGTCLLACCSARDGLPNTRSRPHRPVRCRIVFLLSTLKPLNRQPHGEAPRTARPLPYPKPPRRAGPSRAPGSGIG